jgi:hypothetical protein
MILNDGALATSGQGKIGEDLHAVYEEIVRLYFEQGTVPDYDTLRISREYRRLAEESRSLQLYDVAAMTDTHEQLAWWINLYNMLTIHALVRFHIKLTVWERPNFFFAAEYNIGGYRFSLYDIVHGILRGNRRRWRFFPPPFRGHDPRSRFCVDRVDPRIHFTLFDGSRSCPDVHYYGSDRIDARLTDAARRFLNSRHVVYDAQAHVLVCSKLLKWYADDFGHSKAERLAFIADFIDDETARNALKKSPSRVSVKYVPYDWHLQSAE